MKFRSERAILLGNQKKAQVGTRTISTSVADVTLLSSGVLQYRYHDNAVVDLPRAKESVLAAKSLVSDSRPTLVLMKRVKRVTGDARAYFAKSEDNRLVSSRVALVVQSPVSRVIGNFFIGFNRPPFPVRLFADEASAVEWLSADA